MTTPEKGMFPTAVKADPHPSHAPGSGIPVDQPSRSGMSRRDFLKLAGIAGGGLAITAVTAAAAKRFGWVNWLFGANNPANTSETPFPNTPDIKKFPIALPRDGFTPVTPEEEQILWQNTETVDLENHTFTIGFPVDQATIDKSPNLRMNSYFDQELFVGVPTSSVEKIRQKGIDINQQISGLPKNAKIYYRYDSTKFDASIISIGIAGETKQGYTPAYTTLRIILRDKATGKQYASGIDVLYGAPLVTPASYPEKTRPVYEDGTPINPDEPILQLTTDLQDWRGDGQALPGQKGQVVMQGISINDPIDPRDANIANLILGVKYLNAPNGNIASR